MDDEKLREETLFLAVTRPTMWLGVPIEASLPIALAACLTLIITGVDRRPKRDPTISAATTQNS